MRTVALVVAIALGVAAAIGVRAYMQSMERELGTEHEMINIVVARRDLNAGEPVTPGNVAYSRIPAGSLMPDQITEQEIQRYYDRELKVEVGENVPLRADHFVEEAPPGASARLPEAHRAVTVSVDATSGVAGLVRPGDRVDIYSSGVGEGAGRGQESWRVLGDVTVLAVDDRMSDIRDARTGMDQRQRGYSTFTLSLTPEEVPVIIYLSNNAQLAFALRREREVGEDLDRPEQRVIDAGNVRDISEEANRRRQEMLEEAARDD